MTNIFPQLVVLLLTLGRRLCTFLGGFHICTILVIDSLSLSVKITGAFILDLAVSLLGIYALERLGMVENVCVCRGRAG